MQSFNFVSVMRSVSFLSTMMMIAIGTNWVVTPPEHTSNGIKTYSNFQGVEIYCSPSWPIQNPVSINEIQEIVIKANELNTTIKPFGTRHSLVDIICTDGIPVDMLFINHIEVNLIAESVTVGSGTLLIDLLNELHKFNRTLIGLPSYGGITVGGAMGTGSHGTSLRHPSSISDQAVSMVVVDGTGKLRNITDKEELKAFRVHLGLLGIIYEVVLHTVPQFKLRIINYSQSDKMLMGNLKSILNMAEEHDWFQFWWFPTASKIVISKGNHVNVSIPGSAKTHLITSISSFQVLFVKRLFEFAAVTKSTRILEGIQRLTRLSLFYPIKLPLKDPMFSENGKSVVNPATGFSHEMQTNGHCDPCVWGFNPQGSIQVKESSIAVDIEELPKVIRTLREILNKSPRDFPLFGIFFRFSIASDSLLQMSRGRRSVMIDLATPMRYNMYENPIVGISTWQAIQQALVFKHGGRASWSKNGHIFSNAQVVEKSYGKEFQLFISYMKKFDPNGIFLNEFGRRLLGQQPSKQESQHLAKKHCALLDNCICQEDENCGPVSSCIKFNEFSVCKD